ncbi:CBS domain-containing protein [Saccharospirillum mangrovi]|uniref:CBS domain-containing protein n=1 Tax=Saccharospirillum mangrovi TaxID=2161747 RepID=UPI0013B467F8|nr:CBS domain-containing protein [Saccharospirillum mangrovi]
MTPEPLTVADCMTPARVTIADTATVTEAVQTLLKHRLLGSPVVDAGGQLVGYISEQDCLKHLLTDSYYREDSAHVADVMRRDVLTVSADLSIVDLAQTMTGNKPKKYPVVDHKRIVGEITRTDVLRALLKLRAWHQDPAADQRKRPADGISKLPLGPRAPVTRA